MEKAKLTAGMFTSRTEEWATPQPVYDWLSRCLGPFDLDVCATAENAKCKKFFTKADDALAKYWFDFGDKIWMNPPYGKDIGKWMKRACDTAQNGAMVVCLVPARTDTRWFQDLAMTADEIWFIRGRLKFGDGKQSAPFPSCVVIYRPPLDRKSPGNTPYMRGVKVGD